jgi:hypothetical protein
MNDDSFSMGTTTETIGASALAAWSRLIDA